MTTTDKLSNGRGQPLKPKVRLCSIPFPLFLTIIAQSTQKVSVALFYEK